MAEITTIRDILAMSAEERKAKYRVDSADKRIDRVIIDGNVFTDYQAFSFIWEKTYIKSPTRSGDGTIGNLNSYATFLTPHLKIDFSLLSIDSYRKLMELVESKNEFLVTCYDVVHDKSTTNKMYFSTEELPKLVILNRALNGEEWCELIAVQGYVVEMIGTNADVETITINYYLNSPTGTGQTTPIGSEDVALGSDIVLGQAAKLETFDGYEFNGWHQGSIDGAIHNDGDVFFVTKGAVNEDTNSISFYANWEDAKTYTLTYAYGLGEVQVDDKYMEITSRQVQYNQSIGILPDIVAPTVKIGEDTYTPYTNGAWYRTSVKTEQTKVQSCSPYWLQRSSTIYLLFDVRSYRFNLLVDGDIYQENTAEYNSAIMLPNLKRKGYKFDGWYTDAFLSKKWSGNTMPPHDLILYARWVKE